MLKGRRQSRLPQPGPHSRLPQITRREACKLALGAAAALGMARPVAAAGDQSGEKKAFSLRYILASSLYGMGKIEDILPEVRKTGADAIDLWPKHHADQREQVEALGHERFAELLQKHRVRLGISTRYDLGPFKLAGEMRVVKNLGGRMIVTGSTGTKAKDAAAIKAEVAAFAEKLKPHAALAEELGVTIAIENHANALVHSPDSLRWFAEAARSPALGIALAPYHLPQDEKLLAQLVEDLGPKLVHFYAWQYGRGCMTKLPKEQELEQMPGRGKLDFRPILAALKKIAYHGWTEIFMHPVPRGIAILPTTAAVTEEVNRAREYLEKAGHGA